MGTVLITVQVTKLMCVCVYIRCNVTTSKFTKLLFKVCGPSSFFVSLEMGAKIQK